MGSVIGLCDELKLDHDGLTTRLEVFRMRNPDTFSTTNFSNSVLVSGFQAFIRAAQAKTSSTLVTTSILPMKRRAGDLAMYGSPQSLTPTKHVKLENGSMPPSPLTPKTLFGTPTPRFGEAKVTNSVNPHLSHDVVASTSTALVFEAIKQVEVGALLMTDPFDQRTDGIFAFDLT